MLACVFGVRSLFHRLRPLTIAIGMLASLGPVNLLAQTQSCQTVTILGPIGVDMGNYGFAISSVSTPLAPLFSDTYIQPYNPDGSETIDIGTIITTDYGSFPAGQYLITAISDPSFVSGSAMTITLGSGLVFGDGSQVTTVPISNAVSTNVAIPFTNLSTNCSNPYTPAPVDILDPVSTISSSGASKSLLDGNHITGNSSKLASGGRIVQGVSADGIAQLVLRIPMQAGNDVVKATLLSNCTDNTEPLTCSQSAYSGDDGGLFAVGNTVNSAQSLPSYLVATADTQTIDAFIAYRAPNDFVQQYPVTPDSALASRMTYIQLIYTSPAGIAYARAFVPIVIVRPPVILVHGIFSSAKVFNTFSPLTPSKIAPNNLFYIATLDYSQITVNVSALNPPPPYLHPFTIRDNMIGVEYNAPRLLAKLAKVIQVFKSGSSPSGLQVAAIQADIIAHSLGGLMAEGMTLVGTYFNKSGMQYINPSTYSAGYIHKLITIGTPHFGSEYATRILDGTNNCVADSAISVKGNYNLLSLMVNGKTYAGATHDLANTPDLGGPVLSQLNLVKLPRAFIAGQFTSINDDYELQFHGDLLRANCPNDFLAMNYTFDNWPMIFGNQPSDAFVSVSSATDGLLNTSYATVLPGVVHGPGSIMGIFTIGFSGPNLLDPLSGSTAQVLNLLNTNVNGLAFRP